MKPMSVRNRCAFFGVALGLYMSPAAAQSLDDGSDPFAEGKGASSATGVTAKASANVTTGVVADADGTHQGHHPRMLEAQNTLTGPTGLLHTISADSGAVGTFRTSVYGSYFTGSQFLCPVCSLPNGKVLPSNDDKVSQVGTRIQISATPIDFLEAYAAMRFQSTSNDQGDPRAIQIVGDMNLGVKAFMPTVKDRVLSFGGALDFLMLNSPGGIGLDAASVSIRAIGTADLTRRANESDRIPLRIHLNTGYVFDGSGVLADDTEGSRANTLGNKPRITRIERFGHDINRVDTYRTGLGVEGVFPWVRPFGEWSIDIPVNRQGYLCGNNTNRTAGDDCLSNARFSSVPSRLTIGARVYPWAAQWMEGLAFLAAIDVGTGATSSFVEEIAPQLPWQIHVGVGWAADTAPRGEAKVVEKIVERPVAAAPIERHIEGTVTRAGKEEPVANAVIRYVGRPLTGMVADEQGKFQSASLQPGEYKLAVSAEGYRDGECTATIPEDPKPQPKKPAAPAPGKPATQPAAPAPSAPTGPVIAHVVCELEALPRTATITGVLRDADTTEFVGNASVTITDPLGRQLALKTDAEGTFRFGNVPAGKSKLMAEADGYLRASVDVSLEPRKDVSTDIIIHKRPVSPNVVVTKNEIKLKKEVHFLHGSAEILPDSMAILEEAADAIRSHEELGTIEVQGHTDDTGSPEINLRLSADRANAVRDVFIKNGVDGGRLTAHGYGQEKPLVPNTSPKNRAKNRRVQLVVVK